MVRFRIEPTGFAGRFNGEWERKGEAEDDSKDFGMSSNGDEASIWREIKGSAKWVPPIYITILENSITSPPKNI